MEAQESLRELEKGWNYWVIAAAMIVSFLGTFTSTQLMIQARLSTHFSSLLTWIILISLTFGFCASWSLHFVCILACKLDLPIGLDLGLTMFSAALAVLFTFASLGIELLWKSYHGRKIERGHTSNGRSDPDNARLQEASEPLLQNHSLNDALGEEWIDQEVVVVSTKTTLRPQEPSAEAQSSDGISDSTFPRIEVGEVVHTRETQLLPALGHDPTVASHAVSSPRSSNLGGHRVDDLKGMAFQGSRPSKNAFVATYEVVYAGMCWKAVMMGLVWSLSITSMHYVGLAAMRIPGGFWTLNLALVIVSAFISWLVCIFGYIYMVHIESHLSQQVLFSVFTAFGIAAMHFTGMRATTFWSWNPPVEIGGYPPQLPVAICSVAILTCMLANGLLAHSATLSRNKLAEIVWTRRKLWRAIAQKENAEAAALIRSNFIASASHEIRTPLHHLQGYTDLLSRTQLNEEGRQLLISIQRATKTLSLITNNVLDWSKLESDRDALCRPTSLDIRSITETLLVLLPNSDDEADVEIMAIISPDVPKSLFLDETYIHRIFMNLLSNSLKFTKSGYIILSLEMDGNTLVGKVRDTGTGVPQLFLRHIFEPFSQAQTRGSQRGTGLGLSIVKQLLHKMEGTITVESKHPDEGFGPNETGTTFTFVVPVQVFGTPSISQTPFAPGTIALMHSGNLRVLEGLRVAWELFGHEVVAVEHFDELSNLQVKYVWADTSFLQNNPECLRKLIGQDQWTVFVPFEDQRSLHQLPGLLSTPNFVPLPKPLIWHTFHSRMAIASHASSKISSSRSVRFASEICIPDELNFNPLDGHAISKNVNILLVEDNPINQKLGVKMLTSLGYSIILANDGEEAISQLLKYDTAIDMILMDQSMPVKDGVTATREIRALETVKKLSRRHPIIALTAVVDTESRAQFKDAGADDFLAKPLSLGMLEQTLSAFLHVE